MVSNIDSARIGGQSRSRSEPAPTESDRMPAHAPSKADGDVRLSLSETARRLSGSSISAVEVSPSRDRSDPVRIAAYRTTTRSEVGARISMRV